MKNKKVWVLAISIIVIAIALLTSFIKNDKVGDLNCYKVGLQGYEYTLYSDYNANTLKEQMLLSPAIVLKDEDGNDVTIFVSQIQYFFEN